MIKIQIDEKIFEVKPGKNLLETCLALGFNLPYFCFHPAMGSVGSCRLCAVKKYKYTDDKKGRIVMSCMEPVVDGLIVSVEDPEAKAFRASILESLMTNHPHDCPICDEGGECHLQDMTVMTGHNYRRFGYKKRTHKNQYLGPFIHHEMNRCIQCYRCVRFYKDYAGGKDFDVFAAHNNVYFGRHEEGALENEFSGNLVEVCPTGVFTDKTLKKHYTRKWDLTNAPSICVHCSVGCNIIASERNDSLRRIMSRYNGSVNGYFLCDRGRFGYEFVNDDKRIRKIYSRLSKDKGLEEVSDSEGLIKIRSLLSESKRLIGIGSPRASLEANYALSDLVGKENFYHGIPANEFNLVKKAIHILENCPAQSPSLKEIEKTDVVFILGEDVTNTAPMIALAVRQASRNKPIGMSVRIGIPRWNDTAIREMTQDLKSPVFIATSYKTKLDELAELTYRASSQDIARLGFAIASILNSKSPQVSGLSKVQSELAEKISIALKTAENPLIISGIHSCSDDILNASANIATALSSVNKNTMLSLVLPECNSMGLGMMDGKPLEDAISLINTDEAISAIILENDLYRRSERQPVDSILNKCKNIIVLDYLMHETAMKADVVLPVSTFAESEGTLVNNEGRAQRFYSVLPVQPMKESWRWIKEIIKISGMENADKWLHFNDIVSAMTDSVPAFREINKLNPDTDFLMLNEKIPRQSMRFSGRTAMNANISVSEPKPPQDSDSPMAFSMEGYHGLLPSSLISNYWSAGWNSLQAMNKDLDEPNGSLKGGDPGVRLIEKKENSEFGFFKNIPKPFQSKSSEWFIFPVYHIFGSEELSSKGPAIAEKIAEPSVLINPADALIIGATDEQIVRLILPGQFLDIKLKTNANIPGGLAGLPANLPGLPYISFPGWGKIELIHKK